MKLFIRFFVISLILFILIFQIPLGSSDTVINYSYNTSTSANLPKIVYNNSTITYVKITIYNNQAVKTVNNFQMLVKVNWAEFKEYLNANCSNVRFYNTTSAIGKRSGYGVLPAWIETNDSNNSPSSNVWINLEGTTVPANGNTSIYMAFLPKTVSWNSYLGLNPYLSKKYGQYDNGAKVFTFYDNGTNLMPLSNTGTKGSKPALTNSAPSPFNYAINGSVNGGNSNAGTWTTNGINNVSSPSFNLPSSYIVQMYVYLSGSSALTDLLTNVQSITSGHFYVFRFDTRNNNGYNNGIGYYPKNGGATSFLNLSNNKSATKRWYMMTVVDNRDILSLYQNQYYSSDNFTIDSYGKLLAKTKGVGYTGGGIAVTTDGASSTEYWTLIIVRNLPPNGVSPLYMFQCSISHSLWKSKLNQYKDQAYMNITSIWSSGITCDDNGNVFWTDTFGNVLVEWVNLNYAISDLGSPYSSGFCYAGPITSIAAINLTNSNINMAYVVVLTYYGYAFAYDLINHDWFNATSKWDLPLQNYPYPWTSVTANLEAEAYDYNYGYNYNEGFIFTDLYGNEYQYNPYNGSDSYWVYTNYNSANSFNIISTCAYYPGYDYYNYTYGISYNGNVYVDESKGWVLYDSTGINGLIGITTDNNGNLYLLQINNDTPLYVSSNGAGSTSGNFSAYGYNVFSQGTDAGLGYDQNDDIFWALQTNGTIASSSNPNNGWVYTNNLLSPFIYNINMLSLNSSYSSDFMAYAYYVTPTTNNSYSNMLNFTLYFNGSDNKMNLEYYYQPGSSKNPANPALLTNSRGLIINVTLMPNTSYNSYFNFNVIIYPQNNLNSVILVYILDIRIINHFSYIPLGG